MDGFESILAARASQKSGLQASQGISIRVTQSSSQPQLSNGPSSASPARPPSRGRSNAAQKPRHSAPTPSAPAPRPAIRSFWQARAPSPPPAPRPQSASPLLTRKPLQPLPNPQSQPQPGSQNSPAPPTTGSNDTEDEMRDMEGVEASVLNTDGSDSY